METAPSIPTEGTSTDVPIHIDRATGKVLTPLSPALADDPDSVQE